MMRSKQRQLDQYLASGIAQTQAELEKLRAQQPAPAMAPGWLSADTAPRDGRTILADVGMPWPVAAVWSTTQQEWAVAELQWSVYQGEADPGWVTEYEPTLRGWLPMPDVYMAKGTAE